MLAAGLSALGVAELLVVLTDNDRSVGLGKLAYLLPLALAPLAVVGLGNVFRVVVVVTAVIGLFLAAFGLVELLALSALHLAAAVTPRPAGVEPRRDARFAAAILVAAALYGVSVVLVAPIDAPDALLIASRSAARRLARVRRPPTATGPPG